MWKSSKLLVTKTNFSIFNRIALAAEITEGERVWFEKGELNLKEKTGHGVLCLGLPDRQKEISFSFAVSDNLELTFSPELQKNEAGRILLEGEWYAARFESRFAPVKVRMTIPRINKHTYWFVGNSYADRWLELFDEERVIRELCAKIDTDLS